MQERDEDKNRFDRGFYWNLDGVLLEPNFIVIL